MSRYIVKATGEVLVHWEDIKIHGGVGSLYWNTNQGEFVAFTEEESRILLDFEVGEFCVDVYAIAHRFVNKDTAYRIHCLVEAEFIKQRKNES